MNFESIFKSNKTPLGKLKSLHKTPFVLSLFLLLILVSGMIFPALAAAEAVGMPAVTKETVVLEQNFDGLTELPAGWTAHYGNWSISNGKLSQSYQPDGIFDDLNPAVLTFSEDLGYLESFRFEAVLQFESSLDYWSYMGLGIDVHYPNPITYADFFYDTLQPTGVGFCYYAPDSIYPEFGACGPAPVAMSDGQPVYVKLEVYGEYGNIYFNDDLVVAHTKISRSEDGLFGLIMGFGGVGSYDDIKITALPYRMPSITTDELLDGTVGFPYIQKLAAEGNQVIHWSIDSGAFPTGLSLSSEGIIFGTPTDSGTFNFTVKAENAKGDDTQELSITVAKDYISSFTGNGVDFSYRDIELVSTEKLPAAPKTFEAWVKMPTERQAVGVIAGNGAIDGFNGLSTINFGVTADGNPWLYWREGAGTEANFIAYANVKLGDWVHIAIVQDNENHKFTCYVNGNKADEQISPIMEDTIPIRPLKIGGDYLENNSRCFPGEIADIRVWSTVRNQTEIQENMNVQVNGNEEGLMANWVLDKTSDIYKDNSAQGNNVWIWHEWLNPEFAEGDYTIVVVPDIQYLTRYYPDVLNSTMDWIRDNAKERNIKFMVQVGDLTDTNSVEEWELVQYNLAKLNNVIPYTFLPGNHDYDGLPANRNTTLFNAYLPYSNYSQTPIFGGAYEEGKLDNAYYYFTAGDTDYMLLCLEMIPRNPVLDWANTVVAANPDYRVIVATHSYLYFNGNYDDSSGDDPSGNTGNEIWDKLASQHDNIVMVLCGHIHYDDLVMRTDTNMYGNEVRQLLVDAQDMDFYREGVGMVALLTFSNNGRDVAVNWYSTKMDALFRDWNQFTFSLPLAIHTIAFDTLCGSELSKQAIEHGGLIIEPLAPTRSGYAFVGWFKEVDCETPWDFTKDKVTGNVTLYASWIFEGEASLISRASWVSALSSGSSNQSSSPEQKPPAEVNQPATITATETSSNTTSSIGISGNITASQISNMTITPVQSNGTTVIAFIITGQHGTLGLGNLTIPKSAISYGTTLQVYIDGKIAENQGCTEDANNYYVWYTTSFSTHEITIEFSSTTFQPETHVDFTIYYVGAIAAALILAAVVFLVKREKKNKETIV